MWNINESVQAIFPEVVKWRRALHRQPEIANKEFKTAEFITDILTAADIPVTRYPDSTAIIGTIVGGLPGPTIGLRADMDALPVQEESGLPFASEIPGMMHACGHDLHMSNLLGVASLLAAHRQHVPGTVKLIFQPAEEGGESGGRFLVGAGIMEGIDKIYALHMEPELPTGQISVTPGYCTSNSDSATLTVIGKGGHGAQPETAIDAIVIGAQLVGALQTIVSRNLAAQEAGVVTVGTFNGGMVNNIIAERATLRLSIRSLTEATQATLKERIDTLAQGITAAHGATCEYDFNYGYPAVYNHEATTNRLIQLAGEVLGQENVVVNPLANMVGEDFAYYVQKAPGTLFWLGARGPEPEAAYPLHNPKVTFNEESLLYGMEIMLKLVVDNN